MSSFDRNPENLAKIDEVFALFEPLSRGDQLPYDSINEILGESRTPWWRYITGMARKRLLNTRGIETVAEYGFGLLLVSTETQLSERPRFRHNRARRQLATGKVNVGAIIHTELNTNQLQLQQIQIDAFERKLQENRAADRWLKATLRQSERENQKPPWDNGQNAA